MPRLFTALEIPASVAMQLSLLQGGLPGARWIEREDFHLTLRFVGDVGRHQARDLAETLSRVHSPSFSLQLNRLDIFGNAKPRSLFAGVRRSDALAGLQASHERICQQLGFEPERRKFSPHVTIARIGRSNSSDIAQYLSQRGGFISEPFYINRFVLLSSKDSIGGGPYVIEQTYQLEKHDHVGTE